MSNRQRVSPIAVRPWPRRHRPTDRGASTVGALQLTAADDHFRGGGLPACQRRWRMALIRRALVKRRGKHPVTSPWLPWLAILRWAQWLLTLWS